MANEAIASKWLNSLVNPLAYPMLENNAALQTTLYNLRGETQAAFDDAKFLEKRWKELEREQKEVYQVCFF